MDSIRFLLVLDTPETERDWMFKVERVKEKSTKVEDWQAKTKHAQMCLRRNYATKSLYSTICMDIGATSQRVLVECQEDTQRPDGAKQRRGQTLPLLRKTWETSEKRMCSGSIRMGVQWCNIRYTKWIDRYYCATHLPALCLLIVSDR